VPSTFRNKSPAWSQRTIDPSQHRIRTLNPVQHGVTKDGIEFFLVLQVFAAHRVGVQAKLPRGFDLRNAGIDRHHFAAQIR